METSRKRSAEFKTESDVPAEKYPKLQNGCEAHTSENGEYNVPSLEEEEKLDLNDFDGQIVENGAEVRPEAGCVEESKNLVVKVNDEEQETTQDDSEAFSNGRSEELNSQNSDNSIPLDNKLNHYYVVETGQPFHHTDCNTEGDGTQTEGQKNNIEESNGDKSSSLEQSNNPSDIGLVEEERDIETYNEESGDGIEDETNQSYDQEMESLEISQSPLEYINECSSEQHYEIVQESDCEGIVGQPESRDNAQVSLGVSNNAENQPEPQASFSFPTCSHDVSDQEHDRETLLKVKNNPQSFFELSSSSETRNETNILLESQHNVQEFQLQEEKDNVDKSLIFEASARPSFRRSVGNISLFPAGERLGASPMRYNENVSPKSECRSVLPKSLTRFRLSTFNKLILICVVLLVLIIYVAMCYF